MENIGNVTSTTSFAVATVYLEIIGRVNAKFFFVYTKDLHVRRLDPDNAYISPVVPSIPIRILGTNFIPVDHLIQCKLHYDTPLVITGRYINNHTLECDLPPPPVTVVPGSEYRMVIEISLNGGVQYTNDGFVFTYRPKDIMTHVYPQIGFTYGNTYLTISYGYLYDRFSIRQTCRFSSKDWSMQYTTRIISFDDKFVFCFTPPAYLISEALRTSGGDVRVQISSNNRDFSEGEYFFTYAPVPMITRIFPQWIVKDSATVVTITGTNFYSSGLITVKLESTDEYRVSYLSVNATTVAFVNSSTITFNFPKNVFIEKDFVSISLRFGEETYFMADTKVYVYIPIVLVKPQPKYIYSASTG